MAEKIFKEIGILLLITTLYVVAAFLSLTIDVDFLFLLVSVCYLIAISIRPLLYIDQKMRAQALAQDPGRFFKILMSLFIVIAPAGAMSVYFMSIESAFGRDFTESGINFFIGTNTFLILPMAGLARLTKRRYRMAFNYGLTSGIYLGSVVSIVLGALISVVVLLVDNAESIALSVIGFAMAILVISIAEFILFIIVLMRETGVSPRGFEKGLPTGVFVALIYIVVTVNAVLRPLSGLGAIPG